LYLRPENAVPPSGEFPGYPLTPFFFLRLAEETGYLEGVFPWISDLPFSGEVGGSPFFFMSWGRFPFEEEGLFPYIFPFSSHLRCFFSSAFFFSV